MRKISIALAFIASLLALPAHADFTGKDASLATITFKATGVCASVVCVPLFTLFDPTGTNGVAVDTAGADAVSNTKNGLAVYSRNVLFNGTTWDRWLGDATNGGFVNVKTSVLPTGGSTSANQTTINTSIGTTNTDIGAPGATACASDTASCSINQLAQRIAQNLTTLNTTAGNAVPAGTNRIGYTSDDPCNNASVKVYTPINVVTATNVIITGVSAKKKYICSIFLYPAAADNVAIYQATTATSCATAQTAIFGGTTTATGFVMTAQAGFVVGNGVSSVAATTTVNTDICVTTSAAVQLSGVVVTADQ